MPSKGQAGPLSLLMSSLAKGSNFFSPCFFLTSFFWASLFFLVEFAVALSEATSPFLFRPSLRAMAKSKRKKRLAQKKEVKKKQGEKMSPFQSGLCAVSSEEAGPDRLGWHFPGK
ncbi:hypothetical protein GGR54DRAFT_636946 [Hypoxylon sp. NC1633]|nr:hypothetical protein GGR54DRAFT_636946 [Hypoxylon sp. NC1633]